MSMQLSGAATEIQNQIQTAWSGSFQRDGVAYNVSSQVSVQVAEDRASAMNSGTCNVIAFLRSPMYPARDHPFGEV